MEERPFKVTNYLQAPLELRVGNLIIDYIIRVIIITLLAVFLDLLFFSDGLFNIIDWLDSLGTFESYLFGMLFTFFYCGITEFMLQRTFAKYITGTIVVMEDGSRPDLETIAIRSANRLIPFEALSFLQNGARGWHDSNSKTYVVKTPRLNDALRQFKNSQNKQNPEIT